MAQQQKPEWPKKKLKVVQQNEISNGETNGKPWTLYGVKAEAEDGTQVEEKLKCFSDLSEHFGKFIEFGVEKQTHEKYGDSYMLHPPKRDLKKSVDELRERVSAIEHEIGELKKMIGQAPPATAAAVAPPPDSSGSQSEDKPLGWRPEDGPREGDTAEARFGADDDIPF